MLKIALISDDADLQNRTKPLLTKSGYDVNLYKLNAPDLSGVLLVENIEIFILDFISDPNTAYALVRDIKKVHKYSSYFIAVINDEIAADFDFKSGVDDFTFYRSIEKELELRVELFQWKVKKVDSKDKIVAADFIIDNASYEVTFKGKKVELTFKEFELLKFFMTHIGRVYSRDALLNQVWGYNYYGGTRTVDVHIRRLRSKIGIDIDNYLKTIRNVGYKFDV